jgi:hypothetical protein
MVEEVRYITIMLGKFSNSKTYRDWSLKASIYICWLHRQSCPGPRQHTVWDIDLLSSKLCWYDVISWNVSPGAKIGSCHCLSCHFSPFWIGKPWTCMDCPRYPSSIQLLSSALCVRGKSRQTPLKSQFLWHSLPIFSLSAWNNLLGSFLQPPWTVVFLTLLLGRLPSNEISGVSPLGYALLAVCGLACWWYSAVCILPTFESDNSHTIFAISCLSYCRT